MALYRVTVIFNGAKHGWTESHVFSRSATTSGAFAATLIPWLTARAQLLGREFTIDGARVSLIRDDLGFPVRRNVFPLEQVFAPANQTAANGGDDPGQSIKWVGTTVDGNRSKQLFAGGAPDDVSVNGGVFDRDKVNYKTNFDSWNIITRSLGAGWLGFVALNEIPVTGYVASTTDIVTITVGGAGFPTGDIGSVQIVRIRGVNHGKSKLNGEFKVRIVDENTCKTVNPIALFTFASEGMLTTFDQPSTFFQSAGWSCVKTADKKRGRPLLVSPGRAKARPLG